MAPFAHGMPTRSDLSAPMPELGSAWQAIPGAVLAVLAARHPFGDGHGRHRRRRSGRGMALGTFSLLDRRGSG